MLGYLLGRSGVPVVILEKHADFLRDFRSDTVHPSTLQILNEVDLQGKFDRLRQRKVDHLSVSIRGRLQQILRLSTSVDVGRRGGDVGGNFG